MYGIKLLGPGQAYYDGKAIAGFPGQQHCLLFYYLLLNRQIPHTREQLATVFWGESPPSVARKNLRNALWRLSQSFQFVGGSLEDLITVEEDYITFADAGSYQLDVDEFEAAVRCSRDKTSHELTLEQVSLLERAADLYRGDLLEGVYEDWCVFERERLRLAFLDILHRLMNYHGHHGNYERGLEYGQRILRIDPTREKTHRETMMIHWMAGNRDAALLQYRACREILHRELGVEPMQETRHLHETILRASSSPVQNGFDNSVNLSGSTNLGARPSLMGMLQKLSVLILIVEQTNTELHLLEKMIEQMLDIP